jgi:hypothetical protein
MVRYTYNVFVQPLNPPFAFERLKRLQIRLGLAQSQTPARKPQRDQGRAGCDDTHRFGLLSIPRLSDIHRSTRLRY